MDNQWNKRFLFIGAFLILLGIVVNAWSVGYVFRPFARPITGATNLLIIGTFRVLVVAMGAFFILRRRTLTPQTLWEWYRTFATAAFGAIILFVGLNVVAYASAVIRASFSDADPVTKKYQIPLESFYPGMSSADIALMLQETWSRKFLFDPFAQFRERPYDGQFVNVDENGFRHTGRQAGWPPDPKDTIIFIFGGSTTFNYGVPDDETIASHLQEILTEDIPGRNFAVYNFGRGFFYSSQERALFEKLLAAGHAPDLAVFIDGLNDFNFSFTGDRPEFTRELEQFFVGESYQRFFERLPLVWSIVQLFSGNESRESRRGDEQKIQEVIARYVANKRLIEAVSSAFGVMPVFVWQPISTYNYDPAYHPFGKERDTVGATYGYPVMATYVREHDMGKHFLYLADMQRDVQKPLYVDLAHYSGEMSRNIAERIAEFLGKTGILE